MSRSCFCLLSGEVSLKRKRAKKNPDPPGMQQSLGHQTLHRASQPRLSHLDPKCLSRVYPAFCFSFFPPEKCYETAHLRYYDIGESWGRIHLRNVEQCTCVSGEIECERTRYSSKMCFQASIVPSPCFAPLCSDGERETRPGDDCVQRLKNAEPV